MEQEWNKRRKALITRLKKVEGQLRGIQKMMEEEQSCERVAQQLSAARKALDKTFFETMACAMQQELSKSDSTKDDALLNEQIGHITALLSKYG
ncbi:metal-sensitive transcriptional regulator [Zhongshania sp.]|uniref:metal-sensitive transcriptional regulator n=1 Tax=Zhongshania sp. TaxID=1971902 RepID=UPI0035662059